MERPSLNKIRVAAPCNAEWKWMYGTDQVRFCPQCSKNVYNLSAMTREEAELLILRNEGQLCSRFYRRKDGTIITANCPVGLRAIMDKWTGAKARIVAALLSLIAYTAAMVGWQLRHQDWGVISVVAERHRNPNDAVLVPIMGVTFAPPPDTPTISRSEDFMRKRAVSKLIPIFHQADGSSVTGLAIVSIEVSETGEVDGVTFIQGPEAVRDLVEQAAYNWTFTPTLLEGKPKRVESTLSFRFK